MTEARARACRRHGGEIRVGKFTFAGNGKAIAMGEDQGLVKTVFDARSGELLGAHIIHPEASELITGYGVATALEATEEDLMHCTRASDAVGNAARIGAGGLRTGATRLNAAAR